ncbi:MAG: NUDIX domain-containing protein [Treponema sp.]|jgi:8-oxo-dGTP diphosphatase|nr:NUDIX domain-containing protein [Treponema sp.]
MDPVSVAGITVQGERLFVARRIPGGDLGGKWEFPGGKAEEGESCEEALIREFREEFGAAVTAGPCVASASFEHRGVVRELRAFLVKFESLDFTLREHSAWKWADIGEIEKLDFAGSDRKLIPALKVYLERNSRI